MRRFFWYTYFRTYILLSLPRLLRVRYLDKRGRTDERDKLVQSFLSHTGRKMIELTGSKITVRGLDNLPKRGPVVYVSNHQSHFDSAIILGYIPRPKGFIAAVEASKFPIWSTWFKFAPTVFMERGNLRQSLEAIHDGIELIRKGYSVVVYPEGVISREQEMGEFKRGAFKLATISGAPIVPLTIKDSYQIMGEDNSTIQKTNLELIISQPIPTADLSREEIAVLPEKVKGIIQRNLQAV